MLSHRNVIAQVLQICSFESQSREGSEHQVSLGLLPQSHIYGLTVICHASVYRGDQVIVLPRFTLSSCLAAVQRYHITSLFLVCLLFPFLAWFGLQADLAGTAHHTFHLAQQSGTEAV